MVATDKLFAGSIPEIYDRFLVPSSSNPMRSTSPIALPEPTRGMSWRPPPAPAC